MHTDETEGSDELLPFFCYDEIFGTVLNRFIVQAVADYPLTVYGEGGQTRGYLNLRDTLQCVRLSLDDPAAPGDLRIFNQFTETFSVNRLAEMVVNAGKAAGLHVKVKKVSNPRKEKEEHYYNPVHKGLLTLGLKPNYLTEEELFKMLSKVMQHKNLIKESTIFNGIKWEKS